MGRQGCAPPAGPKGESSRGHPLPLAQGPASLRPLLLTLLPPLIETLVITPRPPRQSSTASLSQDPQLHHIFKDPLAIVTGSGVYAVDTRGGRAIILPTTAMS